MTTPQTPLRVATENEVMRVHVQREAAIHNDNLSSWITAIRADAMLASTGNREHSNCGKGSARHRHGKDMEEWESKWELSLSKLGNAADSAETPSLCDLYVLLGRYRLRARELEFLQHVGVWPVHRSEGDFPLTRCCQRYNVRPDRSLPVAHVTRPIKVFDRHKLWRWHIRRSFRRFHLKAALWQGTSTAQDFLFPGASSRVPAAPCDIQTSPASTKLMPARSLE